MFVNQFLVRNFRNYKNLQTEFINGLNVLVGDNGHGKTNLLEAIYFCSHGRSFRTSQRDHLINQFNTNHPSQIRARFMRAESPYDVEVLITKDKKEFSLNKKRTTSIHLNAKIPMVLFSPESLSVIKEGPEQRRILVDDLVVMIHPPSQKLIMEFQKALKARNKLLKTIHERPSASLMLVLQSLDDSFFKLSSALSVARIQAIQDILREFQNVMRFISNNPNVDILVEYVISSKNYQIPSYEQILNAHRQRGEELRSAEVAGGTSLVGAHKHDVKILYNGNDSRYYCSQGQQRALILSFKIAQIVYHIQAYKVTPILLLDDVLSELDEEKRNYLVKFLQEHKGQAFISSTDFSLSDEFEKSRTKIFQVNTGELVVR